MLKPLYQIAQQIEPENINDNPQTAPSKRILNALPEYDKVIHGTSIATEIGLSTIRQSCPHFDAWLVKLEQLK